MLGHLLIYGLLECCFTRCYAGVSHLEERMIKNCIGKYAEVCSICLSMYQAGQGDYLLEFLMSIRVRGLVLLRCWEIRGCVEIAIFIIGKLGVAWLIMWDPTLRSQILWQIKFKVFKKRKNKLKKLYLLQHALQLICNRKIKSIKLVRKMRTNREQKALLDNLLRINIKSNRINKIITTSSSTTLKTQTMI